jgi:hypothetical protein
MQSSASVRFCRYEVVVTDELEALAEFSGGANATRVHRSRQRRS